MTKMIHINGVLEVVKTQKPLKEIIMVTKSERNANSDLAILHRDIFNIIKVKPNKDGMYDIFRYDRFDDKTFKNLSYLELNNVSAVGDDRFVLHQTVDCKSIANQISSIANVDLGTDMTLTKVNRISFAVKEMYTLPDDHVYAIMVDANPED